MGFIVKIEFGGIQRFIFEVPRLAVIRGANALLGQVIRKELVDLSIKSGCCSPDGEFRLNGFIEHDPLGEEDNPKAMWNKGVLSRDGGHFTAHFSGRKYANDFVKAASALIAEKLPGITVQAQCHELNSKGNLIEENSASSSPTNDSSEPPQFNIPPLSVFQSCQLSHEGVAQKIASKSNEDKFWVSASVYSRHEHGKASSRENTNDVGNLLVQNLTFPEKIYNKAEELNHLAGDDYLALIVADGNDMGNRAKAYITRQSENKSLSDIEQDALYESFYHTARVAMRKAVKSAITEVFELSGCSPINEKIRPFELFMLGGDDLMLACRAKYALPLVSAVSRHLHHQPLADGKPMSIGCGVAIAKAALPMHRMHQVAEALASSAKVKWRGLPEAQQAHSTVDWEVITQAWIEDPIDARVKNHVHQVNNKTLLTTAKPYLCHQESNTAFVTLDTLLNADESLKAALDKEGGPARSQMLNALALLPKGELASTMAWQKVPDNTRECVEKALPVEAFPWGTISEEPAHLCTHYADLMEVHELKNKLRRMSEEKMGKAKVKAERPRKSEGVTS